MKNWTGTLFISFIFILIIVPNLHAADLPFRVVALNSSEIIPSQVAMRRGLESTVQKINAQAAQNSLPKIELITKVAGEGLEGIKSQIRQMNAILTGYEFLNGKTGLPPTILLPVFLITKETLLQYWAGTATFPSHFKILAQRDQPVGLGTKNSRWRNYQHESLLR